MSYEIMRLNSRSDAADGGGISLSAPLAAQKIEVGKACCATKVSSSHDLSTSRGLGLSATHSTPGEVGGKLEEFPQFMAL